MKKTHRDCKLFTDCDIIEKICVLAWNVLLENGGDGLAENIRPDLLSFLTPDAAPRRILVVESLMYLSDLRRMFPQAELYAVTAEMDAVAMDAPAGVRWQVLDYLSVPLPYTRGYFDYIISDLTLEKADNPQDIAAGFSMFLKETGALLTSFRNIRHWSVLQNLMEGHYYHIVSRLYTRAEFENLLYASFYKSIRVQQQKREAATGLMDQLMAAGFENECDDLETEFYLVCASRSMPELSLLKSMYTKEARAQMVRLIHRVEYDVERSASTTALWNIVHELNVFPAYLSSLIREVVVHTTSFYQSLIQHSPEYGGYVHEMLDVGVLESIDPMDRELYRSLQREFAHGKK